MKKRYLMFVMQPYSYEILRPIQQEIIRRGGEVAWFLAGADVNPSSLTKEERCLTSVEEVKAFNPIAVFVPGNIVPDFFPGAKIQVFHGLEYKKKGHFAIREFFDLYCTHGPLTTEPFNQLAVKHPHFYVIETGWPKLDPYFDFTKNQSDKPTLLYAPTFSPSLSSLPHLAQQFKHLSQSGEYQIVIKFHPKTQQAWRDLYSEIENESLKIDHSDNLVPLIQQADVVISDTSSAVDESLLMGKPVITFNNSSPQSALINFTEPNQFASKIEQALAFDAELKDKIEHYIKQVHPYQDGQSAGRVLDATDEVIKQGLKKKPLNLMRKYKIRKTLGYMKIR
jgi:CDP-glycerol glycerophosphotransferase (TagB/SpsB family)